MTKRRVLAMLACGVLTAGLLTGCGGSSSDTAGADDAEITVVSREDGSGTRGAFVELFGVQDEDDKGEKTVGTAVAVASFFCSSLIKS